MGIEESGDTGVMDMEAAVSQMGTDLFGAEETKTEVEDIPDETSEDTVSGEEKTATEEVSTEEGATEEREKSAPHRLAPSSWDKFNAQHWANIHPSQQAYIHKREQQMLDGLEAYKGASSFGTELKGVFDEYRDQFQASGVNDTQAIRFLLNANKMLTSGTAGQREIAYRDLGVRLGIQAQQASEQVEPAETSNPQLEALQREMLGMKDSLQQTEQIRHDETKQKIQTEVEAFANDPSHPYFDEVSDDIAKLIGAGYSMEKAYELAVHANPVTQEQAKQAALTAHEKEWAKEQKKKVDDARKANGANIKSRDTQKVLTGLDESMDETMQTVMKDIRSR